MKAHANDNLVHDLVHHSSWEKLKYMRDAEDFEKKLRKMLPAAGVHPGQERSLKNFLWFVGFEVDYRDQEAFVKRNKIKVVE